MSRPAIPWTASRGFSREPQAPWARHDILTPSRAALIGFCAAGRDAAIRGLESALGPPRRRGLLLGWGARVESLGPARARAWIGFDQDPRPLGWIPFAELWIPAASLERVGRDEPFARRAIAAFGLEPPARPMPPKERLHAFAWALSETGFGALRGALSRQFPSSAWIDELTPTAQAAAARAEALEISAPGTAPRARPRPRL